MAMHWLADSAAGRAISQSPLTRAFSARPPECDSPTPQPLSSTASPTAQRGSVLAWTVPAKSIPATSGKRRTTGERPLIASASL